MAAGTQPDLPLLNRKITSLTGELLTVYEELSLLYSLVGRLGRLTQPDQIPGVALREAIELVTADCGWVVLWDGEAGRVPENCRHGISSGEIARVNKAVLERARDRGKGTVLSHSLGDEWQLSNVPSAGRLLACEMRAGDLSQGYLCLGRRETEDIFTSADQKLTYAISSVTGMMLDNIRLQRSELEKQRLKHELELARQIQRSLLPREFNCWSYLEASGVNLPCYEVGGDYFDLIRMSEERCLVVIADVSGKGPAAALQAAMVQGVLHAASHNDVEFAGLIQTANHCIRARACDASFVTAFVAILDREGRVVYANAGHNPPFWIQAGGQIVELTAGGPMLGILDEYPHEQGGIQMQSGDLLLLYTDGITDLENEQGEFFGTEKLKEWAVARRGLSVSELKDDLLRLATEFSGDTHQVDDLTVLAVRYTG